MIDLTVAVVSYNSGAVIVSGLSQVMETKGFQVVVVDNNSSDGSADLLKARFPSLNVMALDKNEGYGRASNVALRAANTRYVLILNPDIVVTDDDIIEFFDAALAIEGQAAIYAPATSERERGNKSWQPVNNVLGAVMLLDTQRLQSVGWFDDNLFLFYEEKDLCYRVLQGGGQILRHSGFYFRHDKGTSSGDSPQVTYFKQWHVGWSSAYYLCKHGLNKGRMRLTSLLLRYCVKRFFSVSRAKRQKFKARLGGLLAYRQGKQAFDSQGNPRRLEVLTGNVRSP